MKQRSVSILITGSELLDGRVLDTNTRYVAEQLASRGIPLKRVMVVDDFIDEIKTGIKILSEVSEFIIVSGGMGPTTDDLTREACAEFFEVELLENSAALKTLQDFYTERGRTLDSANRKQALIPAGSLLFENPQGTAAGFVKNSEKEELSVFALPGVPREFLTMFDASVLPYIEKKLGLSRSIRELGFKVFGLPEGEVGTRVRKVSYPENLAISFRATFPEIHVKFKGDFTADQLAQFQTKAVSEVGAEFVFSESLKFQLPEVVGNQLISKGLTLSLAESCTGGMISELITSVAGCSRYFLGSVVCYANAVKTGQLNVSEELLKTHGAVSPEVTKELAFNTRKQFGSDFALAVSGVAGPDGGTEEKPVGTVFIGVSAKNSDKVYQLNYPGERNRIRRYASYIALDCLRRTLLDQRPSSQLSLIEI